MTVNIVIMGQSGNGKSTIVNAVMGKDVAPTGKGGAVTKENKIYSTHYPIYGVDYKLNLYDTVGLELSEEITSSTLRNIEGQLEKYQKTAQSSDIYVVWFCINDRNSRFQDFEVDLIKKLSYDYEIPFIIVMTQCFDNQIGELEKFINSELPEVETARILAKDYKLRGGSNIKAYGLDDLIKTSALRYNEFKVSILMSKLKDIQNSIEISEWQVKRLETKALYCIQENISRAKKIAWLPGGCIPAVHGICIKMISDLHKIYGLPSDKQFSSDIFSNIVIGVFVTPMMAIPILSWATGAAYIETIGNDYKVVLENVLKNTKYCDLQNQQLVASRIEQEIKNRKDK